MKIVKQMTTDRIQIEPVVITWARTSASLSEAAAARKLNVSLKTLKGWEDGTRPPTIKQLKKAAKVYKRSLIVFFLSEPPEDFEALLDYRMAPEKRHRSFSYELTTEIRRAYSQREVLLEISELAPESVPLTADFPTDLHDTNPEHAGELLRKYLNLEENTPKSTGAGHDSLRGWISAIEAQGILVLQLHKVATEEVGGFSISEFPYPVIAINGKDWPRRRLFTLMHELAHLALKLGGVCDLNVEENDKNRRSTEARCNKIAATTLLPIEKVHEVTAHDRQNLLEPETLRELSKPFGVSSEAFLLRLLSLRIVSQSDYQKLRPHLLELYKKAQQNELDKKAQQNQKNKQGGPNFYRVRARDLGHGYIASVLDAQADRAISTLDAARYLDVRYDQLTKLGSEVV